MKKRSLLVLGLSAAFAVSTAFALSACEFLTDDEVSPNSYTVTYDLGAYDGEGKAPAPQTVEEGTKITLKDVGVEWDGYDFIGWQDEAGEMYDEGDSYIVTADMTFTAQWEAKEPDIEDITFADYIGVWTNDDGGEIVITAQGADDILVGYAIYKGDYIALGANGTAFSGDGSEGFEWTVSLAHGTLTITDGGTMSETFNSKTALSSHSYSEFEGKYLRIAQKWYLAPSNNIYYGNDMTHIAFDSDTYIIDKYIVITWNQANYEYYLVLAKNGNELEGWYTAPEKAPAAITLTEGNFYAVSVNGMLNQFVDAGKTPDISKMEGAITIPEDKELTGWEIVGGSAFNPEEALNSDVNVVPVFGDKDLGPTEGEYKGDTLEIKAQVFGGTQLLFTATSLSFNDDYTQVTLFGNGVKTTIDLDDITNDGWVSVYPEAGYAVYEGNYKQGSYSLTYYFSFPDATMGTVKVFDNDDELIATFQKEGASTEPEQPDLPDLPDGAVYISKEPSTPVEGYSLTILVLMGNSKMYLVGTYNGADYTEEVNLLTGWHPTGTGHDDAEWYLIGSRFCVAVSKDSSTIWLHNWDTEALVGIFTLNGADVDPDNPDNPDNPPATESNWMEYTGSITLNPTMGGGSVTIVWINIVVNGDTAVITYKVDGDDTVYTATVYEGEDYESPYGYYVRFGDTARDPKAYVRVEGNTVYFTTSDGAGDELGTLTKA